MLQTESVQHISFSPSFTMCSEKSTVLMSSDLQATQPGYHEESSHISQIPGLSPSIASLPAARARGRRAGVLASDSDYTRVAKQGGHKGLLWHEEDTSTSKTESYKPPDWLLNATEEIRKRSEEKRNLGAFQPLEPPFGTDSLSTWERDDSGSNGKEKVHREKPKSFEYNDNVEYSQMEKRQSPPLRYPDTGKFKRTVYDKNPAPVDMSKLLSFGYAGDDKPIANSD